MLRGHYEKHDYESALRKQRRHRISTHLTSSTRTCVLMLASSQVFVEFSGGDETFQRWATERDKSVPI